MIKEITNEPIDFKDEKQLGRNKDVIEQMVQMQKEQEEYINSLLIQKDDHNLENNYFPNENLVDDMKKKQSEQALQIMTMLNKLEEQKNQVDPPIDKESKKKLIEFEAQLIIAKEKNEKIVETMASKKFEDVKTIK